MQTEVEIILLKMRKVFYFLKSLRFFFLTIDCLEEKNQGKFVRVPLTRTTESRWIGPISTPPEKSISPPRVNPPENQIDAKKLNSSNDTPSSQASKINSPYVALEPDMEVHFHFN